ncbi:MAG: hypothetical protein Q9166_008052 [cf. Caloplaca sp. 2 TL-2023]
MDDMLQALLSPKQDKVSNLVLQVSLRKRLLSKMSHPHLPAKTIGIWLLACRANHSCLPNVSRAIVGDKLILRASRPMPVNTEILNSYINIADLYSEQRTQLKITYGLACECTLCDMDKKISDSVYAQRQTISTGLITDLTGPNATREDDVRLALEKLNMTYLTPVSPL